MEFRMEGVWHEDTFSLSLVLILFGGVGLSGILFSIGLVAYPFFRDNVLANSLTGMGQVIISAIVLVWMYFRLLSQIPPKLQKDKEDIIKEREDKIAKLEKELGKSP